MKDFRPRLKGNKLKAFLNVTKRETRVLVIGDLHEPFCLDKYLNFCKDIYSKYNCNKVIFIGDVIDNHYSSYHETNADGLGGGDELDIAIDRIARWYKVFPKADVIIGNHDRIIARKAQTGGIPSKWIRDYSDVLNTPNWNFIERLVVDNVQYLHGEGGTARKKMRDEHQSYVQGHLHSQAYIEWSVGSRYKTFGMQVGCGIDRKSFAMAYGKAFKKPVISCGVVLNKGRFAQVIPMDL